MKQGQASRDVHHTGEYNIPRSKAISPAYTNELGVAYGTHTTEGKELSGGQSPMTTGPGLIAPQVSHRTRNQGSQGKY